MAEKKKNIKECEKLIKNLEKKEYFSAALITYKDKLNQLVKKIKVDNIDISDTDAEAKAYSDIFSYLSEIMRNAESRVESVISAKVASKVITNADQARKSAAGNIFQQLFAYTLAKNVVIGNITANVIVSMSANKILDEYATIQVGDDTQKPDSDVIVYCAESESTPILNYSCKTSCRERAGQTYKWKLLSDLATCSCEHKEGNENCPVTVYGLKYSPKRKVYMCFVTADFYDEIAQPQIAAMFNFFDKSYVAKPTSSVSTIKNLSNVVDDINSYIS